MKIKYKINKITAFFLAALLTFGCFGMWGLPVSAEECDDCGEESCLCDEPCDGCDDSDCKTCNPSIPGKILDSIIEPEPITGLANGTAKTADALGLPKYVMIVTNVGSTEQEDYVKVIWDVNASTYNPANKIEHTFTVTGTVQLPDEVENLNGVSLKVIINVTVNAADPVLRTITIGTFANGNITATPTSAASGTVITLTVTPDAGYRLKLGTLRFNNTAITGTAFTFSMPDVNVTVTAEFEIIPIPVDKINLFMQEIAANGATIDRKEIGEKGLTMQVGASRTIIATVLPASATNLSVTWVSTPTDIVRINNGRITALKEGEAVVTVISDCDGGSAEISKMVTINVISPIEYDIPEIKIPGAVSATGWSDFIINLTDETMTLGKTGTDDDERIYRPMAFSLDGGNKWRAAKPDTFSAARFPRLLNKSMTLVISDKAIDSSTKKPPSDAVIVTFPQINARPKAQRLTVNFAIRSDGTGDGAGNWVLTERGGTDVVYKPADIEIGIAAGKITDKNGYGNFHDSSGIAVPALAGGKTARAVYLIRIGPVQEGSGATAVYTPASKPRRLTVRGQARPPNLKPNKKTNMIRVRAGTSVLMSDGSVVVYDAREEISPAGVVRIWMNATERKPSSASQPF
jgi:hypothetical protein